MYWHIFLSFLDTEMAQIVEILPLGRWETICLYCKVNIIVPEDQVMQGNWGLATMVFNYFSFIIPVSAAELLIIPCQGSWRGT